MPGLKHVLIADDERYFRQLARRILEEDSGHYQVREASDGREAITQTRLWHPDLVILDLAMPGCSGLEVIRGIRADWPACKILVCSVHAEPHYRTAALECGAQAFLSKKHLASQLLSVVQAMLGPETPHSRAEAIS